MKILSIFLLIFFVYLTICEAGSTKKGSKQKEKGSSSLNPPIVTDPIVKVLRDFKIKEMDNWKGFDSLESYLEEPKEMKDYDKMVNEAKEKLLIDKENTLNEFLENVKMALQGRKLRYVRLIGPGSMHAHSDHYDEDKSGKSARKAFLSLPEKYKNLFIKCLQIKAVYQFAVQILVCELNGTIEYFNAIQHSNMNEEMNLKNKEKAIASSSGTNITKIVGTFEDLYVNKSEKEYIEGNYNINVINPLSKKKINLNTNLYKIPSIVNEMEDDEATLILMIECSIVMSTEIIDSYKKDNKFKNLILVDTAFVRRDTLLNFLVDNKLQMLQAFPVSIIAKNFLGGAYIYYSKVEIEKMDNLLVSYEKGMNEDVEVQDDEDVEY
uniref:Uncharacterized protein n=1 Tax=Meloidogyne floridensis TaxID=298350 RepID=A0A915NGP9_9BILA